MSDIAKHYRLLADAFLDRVRATPANRWDAPSPCKGWSARDVVAHVINGHRSVLALLNAALPRAADGVGVSHMADAPKVDPDADLGAAFFRCRDDMLAMLNDPHRAATRLPGGPMGPVPVEQAVEVIGSLELLAHTWDLARAVGGDEQLDLGQVARTHQALLPHYPALQATGAFQASLPEPDNADPQTAFLCFVGRQP